MTVFSFIYILLFSLNSLLNRLNRLIILSQGSGLFSINNFSISFNSCCFLIKWLFLLLISLVVCFIKTLTGSQEVVNLR